LRKDKTLMTRHTFISTTSTAPPSPPLLTIPQYPIHSARSGHNPSLDVQPPPPLQFKPTPAPRTRHHHHHLLHHYDTHRPDPAATNASGTTTLMPATVICSQLHPSEMSGSAIKIALNGSIGLEVTPPEEVSSPGMSSNTSMVTVPSLHHPPLPSPVMSPHSSHEHLQGTIVWYNLMWGKRKSNNARNKWLWTHVTHVLPDCFHIRSTDIILL